MKKLLLVLLICLCGLFISCISVPDGYSKISEDSRIYSSYDEYQDVTFYEHEELFEYRFCKIYYGEKQNQRWGRIIFNYHGDDWIFFKTAIFVNDEKQRVEIPFNYWSKKTHVNDGEVYESVDAPISDENLRKLQEVLNGTNPRLRLSGDSYEDYEVGWGHLEGLKEIIESYFQK